MKRLSLSSCLPLIFFSMLTGPLAFADDFGAKKFDSGFSDHQGGSCDQKLDHLRSSSRKFIEAADRLNEAIAFVCKGDLACIRYYQHQYTSAKADLDQAMQK